jgi:hypothetical protein
MVNLFSDLRSAPQSMKNLAALAIPTVVILALCTGTSTSVSVVVQAHSLKPLSSPTQEQVSIIPNATNLFEFHSGFWVNLHHFLYIQARARMKTADSRRRAVANVSSDLAAISAMSSEDRRQWEAALGYYEQNLATMSIVFDDRLVAITNLLAKQESSSSLPSAEIDSTLKQILESAAGVYRARWWPQHDQSNRDWVKMIDPLLKKYGSALSQKITGVYQTSWPAAPLRVDMCVYAVWAGAYTTGRPARITMGSGDPGNKETLGLETLFHEAMHVLGGRLVAELDQQAKAQNKELPRQLLHAFIFFTVGEVVSQALPDHKRYAEANGLWSRGQMADFRKLLDAHWRPYIEQKAWQKAEFEDAVKSIVKAL